MRPGFGLGGTIHSLLVSDILCGDVAAGEETVDIGSGFIHIEGGLCMVVFGTLGAGGDPGPVDMMRRTGGVRVQSALVGVVEHAARGMEEVGLVCRRVRQTCVLLERLVEQYSTIYDCIG